MIRHTIWFEMACHLSVITCCFGITGILLSYTSQFLYLAEIMLVFGVIAAFITAFFLMMEDHQ